MDPKITSGDYRCAPAGSASASYDSATKAAAVVAAEKSRVPGTNETTADDDDLWIAKARAARAAGMATDDEVSDLIRRITKE